MQNNMGQMMQWFMQNPMQAMLSRKWNIPQEIANNPEAIAQHLLNTGQISQQMYNAASQEYSHNKTQYNQMMQQFSTH